LSSSFQGGPIGGNVNTITETGEYKYFYPINKRRNAIGFRVLSAFTTGYGGREVPPYSRFYMGGENDLRGFDIRGISPVAYIPSVFNQPVTFVNNRNLGGSGFPTQGTFTIPVVGYTIAFPGGDFQGVGNVEYRIPIAGPVAMSLFVDAGTTGIFRKGALKLDPAGVADIRSKFPDFFQQQQLDIAANTNFRLRMSTGIEFIVNLPIVQAPFRIYYAYNPFRLHETIVAPNSRISGTNLAITCNSLGLSNPLVPFNPANPDPQSCDPSILYQIQPTLQNPGRLNYFEPKTTFRFTVSRTF
jgi:outer membrane protein insertion porin family